MRISHIYSQGEGKKSEILHNSPNSPTYCVCCGGIGKLFSASLSDEVGKRKREGREEKATMIIFFIHGGGSLKERETDRFSLNGGECWLAWEIDILQGGGRRRRGGGRYEIH